MSKNYLTYPMAKMKITQNYLGTTSHLPHTKGTYHDYPLDEAGADGGRDYMICPCDAMVVVKLYGVGNSGANTIWLQSKEKVTLADGTSGYVTMIVTHPNDDDLSKVKLQQVFKRGEKMFREGTDGHATGNHLHYAIGKGMIKGTGWVQNAYGKWVLTTTGGPIKPEEAFFIDKTVTTVLKDGGLKWKEIPKETVTKKPTTDKKEEKISVETAKSKDVKYRGAYSTTAKLNLRTGAGTNKKIILELPKGAKVQNYGYFTKTTDGTVWLYIAYGGKEGFAVRKYLKKEV